MDARSQTPIAVTISVPLPEKHRAFLRMLRGVGGRLQLVTLVHKESAAICRDAGYVRILDDGKTVRITGHGQAYLDRLMRAH